MQQSVLVHRDIDERAEVGHVANDALDLHAVFEVVEIHEVGAKYGWRQRVAHVPAGLYQLLHDIGERRHAYAYLRGDALLARGLDFCGKIAEFERFYVVGGIAELIQKFLRGFVCFGVDRRIVEHVLAVADAQEASALLVCFRAELGDFEEFLARRERLVRAVFDYILSRADIESRHVGKQRVRRGIEVDADAVDAVLDRGGERRH